LRHIGPGLLKVLHSLRKASQQFLRFVDDAWAMGKSAQEQKRFVETNQRGYIREALPAQMGEESYNTGSFTGSKTVTALF
jgi:hypothetical protein